MSSTGASGRTCATVRLMSTRASTITAVTNQKGGVGKTATALNVAGALAESGRRVLLVDLDPQGHLSAALGIDAVHGPDSLASALTGEWTGAATELAVQHSITPAGGRLDLIPTTPAMFLVARQLDQLRAREGRLHRLLTRTGDGEPDGTAAVDHILIDCPPTLDVLTDNALTAAHGALIPVQAEDSSLWALRLLLAQIDAVDEDLRTRPLILHGLVVSLLRRPTSLLARSVLERLDGLDLPVIATVPASVTVAEAWRAGQPVTTYAPASEHADAYRAIAAVIDRTDSR